MIDFLIQIFNTIRSLILFLVHVLTSLINLLINIPRYLLYLTNIILNVPAVYIPFLAASIGLYAMFLILNRSQNG